jgi:hypothetical protein
MGAVSALDIPGGGLKKSNEMQWIWCPKLGFEYI